MTRLIYLLCLLCIAPALPALEPPPHNPVPGGVAVLALPDASVVPPSLYYQGRPVMTLRHQQQWWAVVGIALDTEPGWQQLEQSLNGYALPPVSFQVRTKDYPAQYITLRNNNYVEPDPKTQQRITREARLRAQALNTWSDPLPTTLRFIKPVQGRFSSEFGLRRFFNKKPRRPHSGLDIAAPRGTPIVAPAPGRVVAAEHLFFNGKTVFIDHGQGLVTMFCHLDRIDAQPGQYLQTGEALGVVGSTGRVTGPHLHWSVTLNGNLVEPRLFLR
ncbi:MAG: peptidoglycan DD-metalloendopeptidase family protein [Candidatus Competibacteraceae bacterium]|nr:peptidoglycan DD-metalloendopeptidase family protein [Candidatus Competibacteraceae bacterium]